MKKVEITEAQEEFIIKNFQQMKEQDILFATGLSRFVLQKFKRMRGIQKYKGNMKAKVIELNSEYFNVNENWCWI